MAEAKTTKQITIYDIAREAKVSPSTVSRVLTNSANVRPEKRDRVMAVVNKYNFKPNPLAKGLSDTRSGVIGILAADVRNPFYSAVYVACENAALERGYRVILCCSLEDKDREVEQLNILKSQRVDAIIQIGGRVDDVMTDLSFAEEAKQISANVPIVTNGKIDSVPCYRVTINAIEASKLLTEHLIGLGHKKIALVGGRLDVISTYEKYITFRNILKQNGIPFKKEYIVEGGYNHDAGYAGIKKLLALKERPTAIIAINDFSAAGVMRGLTEAGLKIPEDMSVVSYDNTYITDLLVPKLSSIDYDYDTFGKKLVDSAIDASLKKDVPTLQTVTPHLVLRESSGPCTK
ncbi:MAG: LacI family transcriptional regulator [Lachnospiraceae bacterium]|nr:LacI family transcriptional regulator [Lachnospiraceae bacterium]